MGKTVLYIYGYGSNHKDSSTMKVMKSFMKDLGYNLISIQYDQKNPHEGIKTLENYIEENNIKYVIGHSLGGFIALCLDNKVNKLVINPCMKPSVELPKISDFNEETLKRYKHLETWLYDDSFPSLSFDDLMGLFGDEDEYFSYYKLFKSITYKTYYIHSGHRPTNESFDKDTQKKIKEFFN